MPLSPRQAIKTSPAAKLSDDEKETLADLMRRTDRYLGDPEHGLWNGGAIVLGGSPNPQDQLTCTARTMSYYISIYEEAGWSLSVQALDGRTAKAADLINAGAKCPFQIIMTPRWWSPEGSEVTSEAPPAPPVEAGANGQSAPGVHQLHAVPPS
jgi:hypothetical protein